MTKKFYAENTEAVTNNNMEENKMENNEKIAHGSIEELAMNIDKSCMTETLTASIEYECCDNETTSMYDLFREGKEDVKMKAKGNYCDYYDEYPLDEEDDAIESSIHSAFESMDYDRDFIGGKTWIDNKNTRGVDPVGKW